MPLEVRMPRLGEGVIEATISQWLVQEGEHVEEGDPLLEVNTDKVDTEIPAPATGKVVKILHREGETVPVGEVLALMEVEGEAPAPAQPEPAAPAQAPAAGGEPTPAAAPTTTTAAPPTYRPGRHPELGFISPVVAKLANEHGIDLRQVPGTGLGGRITKHDVLAYLERRPAAAAPAAAPQPSPQPPAAPRAEARPAPQPATAPPPQPAAPAPQAAQVTLPGEQPVRKPVPVLPGDELLPLTNIRRRIAEHMVFSERVAPHVTTVHEVDLHRVVEHRARHKAEFAARGVRLTYTAYFVAAAAQALRRHPLVNSSWTDEGILLHKVINIGIAVALGDKGLIVPVIKNADELSLLGIARALNDLTERARRGQLTPDEISGSTFSITNYGTNGSLFGTPIINQPNVAILGVGAIKKRVVVLEGDVLAIRPMAFLSLTIDHRVLDGAVADAFVQDIVKQLEAWGE